VSHLYSQGRLRLVLGIAVLTLTPVLLLAAVLLAEYQRYGRVVEKRLHGERGAGPSRLYSRPLTLRRGQALTPEVLVRRLNALRYEEKTGGYPGEGQFVRGQRLVTFHPRAVAGSPGEPVLVAFDDDRLAEMRGLRSQQSFPEIPLEPELITYLLDGNGPRAKRRHVEYEELPEHLVQCVLAAEDRRFFHHPGVDLFRTAAAAVRNLEAESYVQGGSTITQQLVKNFFLTPQKTIRRKAQEALLAFILERRASKHEILELYMNEIYLGQVGSFGVHGVGEAARVYFQKDVGNLTLAESALLAALIQSPNRYNPHRHAGDARDRRNLILRAAGEAQLVDAKAARSASTEPLRLARETMDVSEAPYFVDTVKAELEAQLGSGRMSEGLTVHTTLDPYLQEVAQGVLVEGLRKAEKPARKRHAGEHPEGSLQGAIIVLEPSTGAILALVGGRSYAASQFDRATQAFRQPGSTFKPFVYLTAFEMAFEDPSLPPLTPATLVEDAPATFFTEDGPYMPANDAHRYLGFVTLRKALALSLNVATMKVAEVVGYPRIARLCSTVLGRTVPAYPSLALGAFEATPLEMAAAFAMLARGGVRVNPTGVSAIQDENGRDLRPPAAPEVRVARAESAYLVTSMLRSVINEGTGSPARKLGLKADAAGKTGTTDENRDAWFIGFTPDLLCAVWMGYDDNSSLRGLSGAEAALPIWTEMMKKATAGQKSKSFAPPRGIVFAAVDRESGLLATERCPRIVNETFVAGAVPLDHCLWHSEM
jgi:penicillin-binding protein 1B